MEQTPVQIKAKSGIELPKREQLSNTPPIQVHMARDLKIRPHFAGSAIDTSAHKRCLQTGRFYTTCKQSMQAKSRGRNYWSPKRDNELPFTCTCVYQCRRLNIPIDMATVDSKVSRWAEEMSQSSSIGMQPR